MAFLSRPFAKDADDGQRGMQQEGMIRSVCVVRTPDAVRPPRIGPGHPQCISMREGLRESPSRLPLVEANNSGITLHFRARSTARHLSHCIALRRQFFHREAE